jgi:hypothetical protein
MTYDRAFQRWIPTAASLISPDGSSYAYAEPASEPGPVTPNRIHVVDVDTGSDRVVYDVGSRDYPVSYAADGIYMVTSRWEASTVGLRFLNLSSGAVRTIAATGEWDLISGGAAWGFTGEVTTLGAIISHVDRLDLATGQVTTWYNAPARVSVLVRGFDWAGHPILLWQNPDEPNVMRFSELVSAGVVRQLVRMDGTSDPYVVDFQADSYGLWIAGHHGVYLYSEQRLRHVFVTEGQPGDAGSIAYIAGTCA